MALALTPGVATASAFIFSSTTDQNCVSALASVRHLHDFASGPAAEEPRQVWNAAYLASELTVGAAVGAGALGGFVG
jgi:hypothetical protein